jgi:hypothetical protein
VSFHINGEKKIEHQVRTTERENTQNEKDKGGVLSGSSLDSRSRLLGVYGQGFYSIRFRKYLNNIEVYLVQVVEGVNSRIRELVKSLNGKR